jgi:hypothetical protein
VTATDGNTLAGINENFGDTASFENVSVASGITVCELFKAKRYGRGANAHP